MLYKGKFLELMTPAKWDGKSRDMLVWDVFSDGSYSPPRVAFVIGFDGYKVVVRKYGLDYEWHSRCAEIP